MKSKTTVIVAILVGAVLLVGGGVMAGMMFTKKDSTSTNTQSTAQQQMPTDSKTPEPAEKTVAKSGVCSSGEIKHLSAGNFTVGEDIASGEYIIKNDNKKDAPFVSLYVYPSKNSATTDEYNRTELAIFDMSETRSVKLDSGNFLKVVYGGLLTCQ